jgi:hypothetical protein
MQTISPTPARPQTRTCAWCCERFGTTVDLLDHVDDTHLGPRTPPPPDHRSRLLIAETSVQNGAPDDADADDQLERP